MVAIAGAMDGVSTCWKEKRRTIRGTRKRKRVGTSGVASSVLGRHSFFRKRGGLIVIETPAHGCALAQEALRLDEKHKKCTRPRKIRV